MASHSMKHVSMSAGMTTLSQTMWDIFWPARYEIAIFICAAVLYSILSPKRYKRRASAHYKQKSKLMTEEHVEVADSDTSSKKAEASPRSAKSAKFAIKSEPPPLAHHSSPVQLSVLIQNEVQTKQLYTKEFPIVTSALKTLLQMHPDRCNTKHCNDTLETLGRSLDSRLLKGCFNAMAATGVKPDADTYAIMMSTYARARSPVDVICLIDSMKEDNVEFNHRAITAALQTSVHVSDFSMLSSFMRLLKEKNRLASDKGQPSSSIPQYLMAQVTELACQTKKVQAFLPLLDGLAVSTETINALLFECVRSKNPKLAKSVENMARGRGVRLTDCTYCLLIRSFSSEPTHVRRIIEEVFGRRGCMFSTDLVLSVLSFCKDTGDTAMADALFERVKPHEAKLVAAFVRFYLDCREPASAVTIAESFLLKADRPAAQRPMLGKALEKDLLAAVCETRHITLSTLLSTRLADSI